MAAAICRCHRHHEHHHQHHERGVESRDPAAATTAPYPPVLGVLRDAPAGRAEWHSCRDNTTYYQQTPVREGETAVTGDDVKQSYARWNRTREPLTHDKKLQLDHCTTMTERNVSIVICEYIRSTYTDVVISNHYSDLVTHLMMVGRLGWWWQCLANGFCEAQRDNGSRRTRSGQAIAELTRSSRSVRELRDTPHGARSSARLCAAR